MFSVAVQWIDTVDILPMGPYATYEEARAAAVAVVATFEEDGVEDALTVFVVAGDRISVLVGATA